MFASLCLLPFVVFGKVRLLLSLLSFLACLLVLVVCVSWL